MARNAPAEKPLTMKRIGDLLESLGMQKYAAERTGGLAKRWYAAGSRPNVDAVASALGLPRAEKAHRAAPDALRGDGVLVEWLDPYHTMRDDHVIFVQVGPARARSR